MFLQSVIEADETFMTSVKVGVEVKNDKAYSKILNNHKSGKRVFYAIAGEMLEHTATSNVAISDIVWEIDGKENTITGFSPTLTKGEIVTLTTEDLQSTRIRFCWWKPGEYSVTCRIDTVYGSYAVTNTFIVSAPKIIEATVIKGESVIVNKDGSAVLTVEEKTHKENTSGLKIICEVENDKHNQGYIGGIRTVERQRTCTTNDEQKFYCKSNGEEILDAGNTDTVIYQNSIVTFPKEAETVIYNIDDSPECELNHELIREMRIGDTQSSPQKSEKYSLYIMYYPGMKGSMWVPLKVITYTWKARACYDKVKDEWVLDENSEVGEIAISEPDKYPVWNMNNYQCEWLPT